MQSWIGGFAFCNEKEISKCYAKDIIEEKSSGDYVALAGFVENNLDKIKYCYADSEIISNSSFARIGGFVQVSNKNISSSYATGKIIAKTARLIGGFISYSANGNTISDSFAAMEISYESVVNLGAFGGETLDGAWYEKCHYNADCAIMQNGVAVDYTETNANISPLRANTLYSAETLFDSLFWNKDVWVVDGINPPKLLWETVL